MREIYLIFSIFASLSKRVEVASFLNMVNFVSFITLTQARIHDLSPIDSKSWDIFSSPSGVLKFITEAPPKLLNFDFIIQNACSTGATSGQYGAENLTWNSKSFNILFVSLDEYYLELSNTTIGKSPSS